MVVIRYPEGWGRGLSRAAGRANSASRSLGINKRTFAADFSTERAARGECCLTGCLLDTVAVFVEMFFEKQHAVWGPLVRGWRRWGSATGGCLPECLELVVFRLGVRGAEGTHPHSEPQARSLLCHLILREYICLSDPQFPHLYYEEVELVWWIPKYHMEEKKKMEVL